MIATFFNNLTHGMKCIGGKLAAFFQGLNT